MRRTYTLRSLFLAACGGLILLPLIGLIVGMIVGTVLNFAALDGEAQEIEQIEAQVHQFLEQHWEELGFHPTAFATAALTHEEQVGYLIELRDLAGEPLYISQRLQGSSATVQATHRLLFVRRDGETVAVASLWAKPATALSGYNRILSTAGLTGLGVQLLLLLLLLWGIGRLVLRPLAQLQTATATLAQGDLTSPVPPSTVRELSALAISFNQMRDQLRASLARQAELEQERLQFIAAIGHDLRTPVAAVRAYAEGLQDGLARDPQRTVRYSQVILQQTQELERLVEELFEVAKLELNGYKPRLEAMPVDQLLDRAVEGLMPLAAEREIDLCVEGGTEPPVLSVDPELLIRALRNLIENGLRHTPPGGEVRLRWAVEAEGGVRITVADSGEGIPPEEIPHLFTPLHRTDHSRSRHSGGTGLGLAIVKGILSAHGGQVSCESSMGEGSRFHLWLPHATAP